MTPLWSSEEAEHATGGRAQGRWAASGVSIDTRTLRKGDLFVALKDQRDGHEFVADALRKGAAAAMVSSVPGDVEPGAPLLVVKDTLAALTALGAAGRARTSACVVGVTGSAGKTSTKEMLRAGLARQGKVHAAEASYNNHWGVPLTLARMPADAEFAIIEIGMNAPGEIAPLSGLARPHVALVTTVAAAHLAAFDDIDGIATEKASIFAGLEPGGTAIYNADIGTSAILAAGAAAHAGQVLSFGLAPQADARVLEVILKADCTVVRASILGEEVLFKVGAVGKHFALNATAALAAVSAAGGDVALAAIDFADWEPPQGRGVRETIVLDPVEDHLTIELIDDAFNANPASMSAALEVLASADPKNDVGRLSAGRRVAILGDMLELGSEEETLHRAIAGDPAMGAVDVVHCVGPRMSALWDVLPGSKRGRKAVSAEELAVRPQALIDAGDVVLVKGSKGIKVSLVVDAIRNMGHPRPRSR